MAIDWHYVNDYVAFGVDWNWSATPTEVDASIKVYRWDRWMTDNTGCTLTETLSPDPYGGGGPWHPQLKADTAQNQTKLVDSFTVRTYKRTHSAQTVKLKLSWDESFGSWYGGSFHYLGAGSHTFTLDVSALASYAVKFNANGGTGAPAAATKWHGEALTLPATAPTRANHTFVGWATSSNATSAKYRPGGTYTANAAVTLYAVWKINPPVAPTACAVGRVGDNRNDVSWTLAEGSTALNAAVLVERSIDGGAWSQAASVAGSATSWSDTSTAANHAYRYRVRASNASGKSAYATSGAVYNTPAAPVSVTASRTGEASVSLAIVNPANTATALQYEYAATTAGGGTVTTVEGAKVTSATANPGGGTWYFRARNTRGALVSAWSPWSDPVVTICPPEAPILSSPASGSTVELAGGFTVSWQHNPPDGSQQTAAQVRYSTDGGSSWTSVDVTGSAMNADVQAALGPMTDVLWGVRTKGVHEDFGPWSENGMFRVRKRPSVSFLQPVSPITNTPVMVELSYSDESGAIADCVLTIVDSMGSAACERKMGAALSCSIPAGEWLPKDGETYTLRADVRSTSTLTSSAEAEIAVDFILPVPCDPFIRTDPDTGEASVVLAAGTGEGLAEAVAYSLWREYGGRSVLLADRVSAGAAVTDAFAPLNVEYSYRAVSFADSGAASETSAPAIIRTPWWFVIYDGGAAKAMWEPSGSRTPSRTKDELLERDGREWPVLIQGRNKSLKVEFSGWVETKVEADAFEAMAFASGDKVYKGLKGEVWHCHAEASVTDCYEYGDDSADVSVTLTRVSGGDL